MLRGLVGAAAIAAIAEGLIAAEPSDFTLWAECASGDATAVVIVGSWEVDGVQGWTWRLSHDPGAVSVGTCGGELPWDHTCDGTVCPQILCPSDMAAPGPDGQRASYHRVRVDEDGITQSVVLDFLATWSALPRTDRFEMLRISYTLTAESASLTFLSSDEHSTTALGFVVDGSFYLPASQQGITLPCTPPAGPFVRGDVSTDSQLDLADAIFTLSYLFAEGPAPTCVDAGDANDDGAVDIGDAIAVLNHLFNNGADLPEPFGACGEDPTADLLGCIDYPGCPQRD